MIKLLLIDDDRTTSLLLKRFLEVEGFEVLYAEDGEAGWDIYSSSKPDLILLDINMPKMNGFELAEKIRKEDNSVVIFFLSDRTEKNDRLRGFSLKGNDYIPKPFYPEEVVAKIRERFHTAEEYRFGATVFYPSLCQVEFEGTKNTLTVRQTEILTIFASNLGEIVNREDILKKVWGDDSNENSLALNVQITYLRNVLKADTGIAINSIKGRGYLLRVDG